MIRAAVFFVIFYILAYFLGSWADVLSAKIRSERSFVFTIAFGGCIEMLAGMLVCLLPLPVKTAAAASAALVLILAVSGFIVSRRILQKKEKTVLKFPGYADAALTAAAIALLIFEIFAVMTFRTEITEAIKPVRTATFVFDSGRTMAGDPMMVFIGMLSSVFGCHPLEFIYSAAAPVFIVLYNLCYIAAIDPVLSGREKTVAFIAAELLTLRGFQSAAASAATLLLCPAGTWVYIIHGICPVASALLIRYVNNLPETAEEEAIVPDDDPEEEWDMKKHRIVNARNLAIALAVLAAVLVGAVAVLNNKINKLYDVTVSLERDMSGACAVFEYSGSGGKTDGYLLKTSDGKITFIGGGGAENANSLKAFLEGYSSTVDTWYVYSEEDDDAGAMRELTSSGAIKADRVYVIDRKEITGL
ncbi:MAG: hypothetical protein K6F73_10095 [Lachnospiraceae bacterium]|nr:hypothetical protein [Lachnospiraceae bacterium]